ncbi:S8 family peptidase [Pseudooceanicola sp. 502str34]
MPTEAFSTLQRLPDLAADESLIVELVFDAPRPPQDLAAALTALLPEAAPLVTPAFEAEADRFFFVTFPGIPAEGQEPRVFAFARALKEALGASDANPVLRDSLYGAAAVGDGTAESLSLCETKRTDIRPFGWVHPVIRTPQAWTLSRGQGATVAVIDTGHSTHQELWDVIRNAGQKNYVEGGTDASDRFVTGFMKHPGHGTLVCSVIASRGTADASGETGGHGAITGAAPEAKVLPIRAIKSVVNFNQTTIGPAIAHAVAQGADVIAMALGGPTRVAATEKALRDAVAAGVVICCAAGNCWPWVVFPAAYAPQGICTAVAALTQSLTPWGKTGSGPAVTLSAPGENVWGAAKNAVSDPDNGIRAAQGTTLATSLTAGCAALWVARHGGRAALKAKADAAGTTVQAMFVHCATHGMVKPPVWNGSGALGAGVLDAERLLNAALPTAATGHEAVTPPVAAGVQSTDMVLQEHLAANAPQALDDYGPDLADYAPEMLWLSYRHGARARAAEAGATTEAILKPDPASPGLSARLAARPALSGHLGVF